MTNNQNDDPLIAEIEKRMADIDKIQEEQPTYSSEWYESNVARNTCSAIIDLVKQDRARQQAEKEKMIAEVKHKIAELMERAGKEEMNNYALLYSAAEMEQVLEIIQGKEQEQKKSGDWYLKNALPGEFVGAVVDADYMEDEGKEQKEEVSKE